MTTMEALTELRKAVDVLVNEFVNAVINILKKAGL